MSHQLLRSYYQVFNGGDRTAFLALLTEDVIHDLNQGGRETGRDRFATFLQRMDRCYRERIADVRTCISEDGTLGSAEYVVHGSYLAQDDGLPPATGQQYVLPGAACFSFRGGRIARVSNYYNLNDWLRQVGAAT